MNQIAALVQGLIATQEAQRAQLEALLIAVQQLVGPAPPTPPSDPVQTCPSCGATGETQEAVRMMSGTTKVFCRTCKQSRVVGGPSTE